MRKKCLVLFSGGLDSRLAIKIMQERGYLVQALFFKLPFGSGCCNESCSFNFSQTQGIKLEIVDCTRGKMLQKYLEIIKNPKYGRGAGLNPCRDCRIFMFKEARKFADKNKIKWIVSGEVLNQRPMSQRKKQMELIAKESGLGNRLIRPLVELGIDGKNRKVQMDLAKKYGIKYPSPGGGCLLCEKGVKKRMEFLLNRGMDEIEVLLLTFGRHFNVDNCWVVLGKNEEQNKMLEKISKKKGKLLEPMEFLGPNALILDKKKGIEEIVWEIIHAYSKKGSVAEKKNVQKFSL